MFIIKILIGLLVLINAPTNDPPPTRRPRNRHQPGRRWCSSCGCQEFHVGVPIGGDPEYYCTNCGATVFVG